MPMPRLFEEPTERITLRVPTRLVRKAKGNKSTIVATSLEHFLENSKFSEVVEERDTYRDEMERMASILSEAKRVEKRLLVERKKTADLKRSIAQTLRTAVGETRAKSMKLYRRCVDDLAGFDVDIGVIQGHLNALDVGVGAA